MANAIQFDPKRGMKIAHDSIKDGKKHTLKSLRGVFAKNGLKKGVIGRMYRLGRMGRALKLFDIVIDLGEKGEMHEGATFQKVTGVAAKKVFAEKAERYGTLSSSREKNAKSKSKSKTPKKTSKTKAVAKKAPAKKVKKAAPKAAKKPAKKVAVTAGAAESEAASSEAS